MKKEVTVYSLTLLPLLTTECIAFLSGFPVPPIPSGKKKDSTPHTSSLFPTHSMLITYDDVVKISDFGTSKELSDKSTKMSFAGTVAWMAPEVIRNEPVSEKVDIW